MGMLCGVLEERKTGFAIADRRHGKTDHKVKDKRNAGYLDQIFLTSNSYFCFPKNDHFRVFRIRINEGKQMLASCFCILSFTLLLS